MLFKKILAPMMMAALGGLTACNSSTEPENPPAPTPGSSSSVPTPVVTTPALSPSANVLFPASMYTTWLGAHYVTMETESTYYGAIAGDFGEVFLPQFLPAARVMWNTQGTTTYYGKKCAVETSTNSMMKRRACTVSEGIGYGMLITYFAGDTEAYNRIWNYSRAMRFYTNQDLTPWITKSFYYDIIDDASATDADIDIATSLILMYFKYQVPAYLEDALKIVNAIWNYEINKTSLLIYSGNTAMWNEKSPNPVYNLSYFSPVALRLFAAIDPDPTHNWTGVLDAMYNYMIAVQTAGTGVVPDWSDGSGVPTDPNNSSAEKTYWTFNKEAVRVPWRIAWDYYWYQDSRAAQVLNTLNAFIVNKTGGDPNSALLAYNYSANLASGADIAGTTVQHHWYGAWCLTGIAGNPAWLSACTDGFNAKALLATNSSYFADILQMMMSQLLNGLYIRPF